MKALLVMPLFLISTLSFSFEVGNLDKRLLVESKSARLFVCYTQADTTVGRCENCSVRVEQDSFGKYIVQTVDSSNYRSLMTCAYFALKE